MECVTCRLPSAYNRAVVDTVRGEELGGLCIRCEEAAFGATLGRGHWSGDECVLCDRDGFYAVPEWEAYTTPAEPGVLVSRADYEIDDETPLLCDDCFHDVRAPAPDEGDRERAVRKK